MGGLQLCFTAFHPGNQAKERDSIHNPSSLLRERKGNMANSTQVLTLLTRSATSPPVTSHWPEEGSSHNQAYAGGRREGDSSPGRGRKHLWAITLTPLHYRSEHIRRDEAVVIPVCWARTGSKIKVHFESTSSILAVILYHIIQIQSRAWRKESRSQG